MKEDIIRKLTALTCLSSCLLAATTQAAVIANESFDYSPFGEGVSVAGSNGGTGWSGAWSAGSTGNTYLWGLNMDSETPTGYTAPVSSPLLRILSDGSSTLNATRNLASSINLNPTSQSVYYFSYLWARTDFAATNGSESSELTLQDSTGASLINFGVNGNEQIFVGFSATATGSSSVTGTDVSQTLTVTGDTNSTGKYLLVGKLVINDDGSNDEVYLSVFDSADTISGEPETWNISTSADSSGTIEKVNLSSGRFAGATYWDNLLIGSSFEDVTAIPEPASVGMIMGIGMLGFMASRRKQNSANR